MTKQKNFLRRNLSDRTIDKYDLEAKNLGIEIIDYNAYHRRKVLEFFSILVFIFLVFIVTAWAFSVGFDTGVENGYSLGKSICEVSSSLIIP